MKPQLVIGTKKMRAADLGQEASLPDLAGGVKNAPRPEYDLGEEDEIYDGYGRKAGAYPYRPFYCYTRELKEREVKTAVLENDALRAEFLLEYGGRLWSLTDKSTGRDLLFTNPVLRFCNLAIRNAWFSGGVEWNVGLIGHTPFTTCPLFAAAYEENGVPVLRMYEYERVREVTYQMDFWLGEADRFLNARMRIVNTGDEVVPMYWWSNMAVPTYPGGRLAVPSSEAYTARNDRIYKVGLPSVDGVDITFYHDIPRSVDHFFEIAPDSPRYIANLDAQGYGLLQMSTKRQQGRKLFTWGNKQAAAHWQEFLSEGDGRYVEIQAGLPKTQYGCIPMAPHTAWEWLERYGAVQIPEKERRLPFEQLRDTMTARLTEDPAWQEMEQTLCDTKPMALKKAEPFQKGSGYGAMKEEERRILGKRPLSGHLDFGEVSESQRQWLDFLQTGELPAPDPSMRPEDYLSDEAYYQKLLVTVKGVNSGSWFAWYHLGLHEYYRECFEEAYAAFEASLRLAESPWALHGLAASALELSRPEEAARAMERGILLRSADLSFLKEGFRLLLRAGDFARLISLYESLPADAKEDGRLKFCYIFALSRTERSREAYMLLTENGGLVVPDVREGEHSVGELYQRLCQELGVGDGTVPYCFDFHAV